MTFSALKQRHEALLSRQDSVAADELRRRTPSATQFAADVQQFVADAVTQSGGVVAPGERDLLRAYLRYWATFIYDWSGVFPKTDLRPAERQVAGGTIPADTTIGSGNTDSAPSSNDIPNTMPSRTDLPGWLLPLAGLLGLVLLLAAGFFLARSLGQNAVGEVIDPSIPVPETPLPPTTRTPVPETAVPAVPIDLSNATQVEALTRVEAHTGGALAVAFDPVKPEIATGGADGRVRFWTVPDLTLSRQLDDQRGWVRTIAYSPYDGRSAIPSLFLTGGNDRLLRVYDLESLQLFAEYMPSDANSGFVFAGRFSPDGLFIASGHGDGVARIWDVASGTETQTVHQGIVGSRLAQIPSGGTSVQDVAYRADGANLALAMGGSENGVMVVDDNYRDTVCGLNSGPALSVAYSPHEDLLAAGTERGSLILLSPAECDNVFEISAHDGGVTDVAFNPSGEWLVTSGRDGKMIVWSADGSKLATLDAGVAVEAVAVGPESSYIASADATGRLILWGIPHE